MKIMRVVRIAAPISVLALYLAFLPSVASATSIATSSATLDWSGFTIGITGNYTAAYDRQNPFFNRNAVSTTLGGFIREANVSPLASTLGDIFVSSAYSNTLGYGTAQALSQSGLIDQSVAVAALVQQPSVNQAWGDSVIGIDFTVSGSGPGTLTFQMPYTISIACSGGQTAANPYDYNSASVWVSAGIEGSSFGSTGSGDKASCNGVATQITRSGTLKGSFSFSRLSTIYASVRVYNFAQSDVHLPEPSSAAMVLFGGITGGLLFRRRRAK